MTDRTKLDKASQDPARILNESDGISVTRRRLVKGSAAAVPVVLTLHSGAVAALVSNQECVYHDRQTAMMDDPPGILEVSDPPDIWVRKTTRCRNIVEDGNPGNVLFKVFLLNGTVFGGDDDWLPEVNSSTPGAESAIYRQQVPPDPVNQMFDTTLQVPPVVWDNTLVGERDCDVLVHVLPADPALMTPDPDVGEIKRYGSLLTADPQFNPITVSCWCSINPNFNLP